MTTDTLHDFATGVWSLRYVLLFVAFLAAVALALVWRHERDDARQRLDEAATQLVGAWRRIGALTTANTPLDQDDDDEVLEVDDPLFSEGYVYDRLPSWVPADVPGAQGGAR